MDSAAVDDELPSENAYETLQAADGTIEKIIDIIEALRAAKQTLILKEDKTPDDEAELEHIKTTLDRDLKTLNELFELVNPLLMKIQTQTHKRIVRDNDQSVSTTDSQGLTNNIRNPFRDSSEFRQVLVVNRNNKNGLPPTIMVLESMTDFEEAHDCQSCSTITECELNKDPICCNEQVENSDNDTVPVNGVASKESYYARLNGEVCKLKEQTQNIIDQNQQLRFELESTIERNNLLSIVLQCPAPFKTLTSGEIIFPGKKEMEEKLLLLKKEIIELNGAIKKIHINQMRLKTAKKIMIANQNNSSSVNCQCKCPKENYDKNNIKVKDQQIKHIESQIIEKNDELNRLISGYNSSVRANSKIIAKNKQLNDNLIDLKKEIEIYDCAEMKDVKGELNKKDEEIETMELIIKENTKEINHYDEKLKDVLCDIKEKTDEIKKIDVSLAVLKKKYDVSYIKLKSTYQEQLEEMIALPTLLKASLVKLQEEIDKKALAEETKDKLEREISEEQNKKKPVRIDDDNYDEKEKKLKIENQMIKSRLKFLGKNIKSETENLKKQEKELDDIREQVAKAVSESTKHINAFKKFSTIQMEKICNEIQELHEILTKSQTEECAKNVVEKSARKYITSKLESIHRNLEKCRLEAITFLDRPNKLIN